MGDEKSCAAVVDAGGEEQLDGVVYQMVRLGDNKGLEMVGLMAARVKFTIKQVTVKALMEAQRQRGGPSEGCGLDLVYGEAIKLVWNCWVVIEKDKKVFVVAI